MRVILKMGFAAIVVVFLSAGASKGNSLLQRSASFAMHSAFARVIAEPQKEEPRGPNVFIWYCCNGVRFHSIQVTSRSAQGAAVELYWGINYQSAVLRFPNCRGGKVTMTLLTQGSGHEENINSYDLTGELVNGATSANCDVIADVYQGGGVVHSQDFRVSIEEN